MGKLTDLQRLQLQITHLQDKEGDLTGTELYSNIPNPLSDMTSISFFAPEDGKVMIGIYDMLGNLVEELTNENYNPGMYKLEFSSEDVAPGTYFIRMTATGFSTTNTTTIVK